MRRVALIAAVALLAAAGGYFAAMKLSGPGPEAVRAPLAPPATPAGLVGQRRPDFAHRDPAGRIWSAADFDGQPLLLNFWATWCAPCVEEMPMLSALQREHATGGLHVVGIALDDPERAAEFAAGLDLAYPVLIGETDVVMTGQRYGNRSGMLPFTVLIDAGGIVRWTHLGALEAPELAARIAALE
jgi:thiol-disulfide isomerase/thioredoxin